MSDRIAELEAELSRLRAERDALASALAEADVYRVAIQNAPVGVMCTSMTTGEYIFSNATHAALLGYTPEEIVSSDPYRRWSELTHPEDFERELVEHQRLARGEIASFESERRCIRKNGEVRWLRVSAVGVRNDEGRLAYLYVYLVDIHEHRAAIDARDRLEEQLRQSQKLEALGRLAGGVAHDFNNRLLIIMGHAELLKNSFPPDSAGEHHASTVIDSAERAAELTHQLLAYSRRQLLKPQAFDVNFTVDGMRRLLERLIGDNIQLFTALGAQHLVFSDPGQIEQVILNLAINARDAMPRGGRLTLETRDVVLGADPKQNLSAGDYVALIVTDTGTGIPEHVLPRIFEPFFTTKDVGSGTGLGLAMVEGIVRQSSGSIQVKSRQGVGTTFEIYLPRASAMPVAASAPRNDASEPFRGFETVLICDDDDGVREILANVLKVRAYVVLQARNGAHALEVARAHQGAIDLLITDLVMPGLSGTELAAELRESQPDLEVLYVSGYTDDRAVLSGALGPGAHFLPKPFLPGEFARTVHAILTRGDLPKAERTAQPR
jgi:two-component system cell cycle sensor histidine kinase/response regulator CckA